MTAVNYLARTPTGEPRLAFPMCTSAHTARDLGGTVLGRHWCTRPAGHGGNIHIEWPMIAPSLGDVADDSYQWPEGVKLH